MKQRILSDELALNSPGFFQVYIDKAQDRIIINANAAIDQMYSRMKADTKFAFILLLKRSGLIAETNRGKEIVKIRYEGGKGKQIPAVILKLSPFGFSEEYLSNMGQCPWYEVVKDEIKGGTPAGNAEPEREEPVETTEAVLDSPEEDVPSEEIFGGESFEDISCEQDKSSTEESSKIDDDFLSVEHHEDGG